MADWKLVTVIGIHAKESLISGTPDEQWLKSVANQDCVFAVLYKGGHIAPLSGQSFQYHKHYLNPKYEAYQE